MNSFNNNVILPYGLNVHHIAGAMVDCTNFIDLINTQLTNNKLNTLQDIMMPANFSSMVGEFIVSVMHNHCTGLIKNNYPSNGHPDLVEYDYYENNSCQYGDHGIEVKCSRNDSGWQGHNPESSFLLVIVYDLNNGFKFKKILAAKLEKDDWNFSGRKEGSRRTATASINKKGREKLEDNWIYRADY